MTLLRAIAVLLLPAFAHCAATSPVLPTPTGPQSVGRVSFHWVDAKRRDPNGPRELLVYVWYPALTPKSRPSAYASYLPGVEQLKSSTAARSFSNLYGPS